MKLPKETETQIEKKYFLELAGGFGIQVLNFHANSLDKFIRAYLSNYFNALVQVTSSSSTSSGVILNAFLAPL